MTTYIELNTERLFLRPIRLDDAEAIYQYRADSKSNQFQGWIPETIDDVHDFINNKVASAMDIVGTWYQFVIIEKETQEVIGDAGVHFLDSDRQQVEVGCTLDKNHQGKGYAAEALNEVIRYLFIKLRKHRIIASLDPRNIQSIKLVERLGFRKEAHFRKSIQIRGEWVDDVVYAILQDEWMKNNH